MDFYICRRDTFDFWDFIEYCDKRYSREGLYDLTIDDILSEIHDYLDTFEYDLFNDSLQRSFNNVLLYNLATEVWLRIQKLE